MIFTLIKNVFNYCKSILSKFFVFKSKASILEENLIKLENLLLSHKINVDSEKFNKFSAEIFSECKSLVVLNYKKQKLLKKTLVLEVFHIVEFLPLYCLILLHQIFLDVELEKKFFKNEKFINITVEIIFYEPDLDDYISKVLFVYNYNTIYFYNNLNIIRNIILTKLLDLFNYYKIKKILCLKIILI